MTTGLSVYTLCVWAVSLKHTTLDECGFCSLPDISYIQVKLKIMILILTYMYLHVSLWDLKQYAQIFCYFALSWKVIHMKFIAVLHKNELYLRCFQRNNFQQNHFRKILLMNFWLWYFDMIWKWIIYNYWIFKMFISNVCNTL